MTTEKRIEELIERLENKPENKEVPISIWNALRDFLASSNPNEPEEEARLFLVIYKKHLTFDSILPGLENLGAGIRSAIAKAKGEPRYSAISDKEWQQIGLDLSDPRGYYLMGCGHIAPPQSKLDLYVTEAADSLLRENGN